MKDLVLKFKTLVFIDHLSCLFNNNNNSVICFDSFGVEHIPKEIFKNLSKIKTIKQIFSEYKHMIQ